MRMMMMFVDITVTTAASTESSIIIIIVVFDSSMYGLTILCVCLGPISEISSLSLSFPLFFFFSWSLSQTANICCSIRIVTKRKKNLLTTQNPVDFISFSFLSCIFVVVVLNKTLLLLPNNVNNWQNWLWILEFSRIFFKEWKFFCYSLSLYIYMCVCIYMGTSHA